MAAKPKPEKRGVGRPMTRTNSIPEFSGMEQMANATGIPLALLKKAKRDGCLFVNHGRCDLVVFLRWFFSRELDPTEDVNWANREKRASALIKEVKLEQARKEVVPFQDTLRFVSFLTSSVFFGELERLAEEFPAALKGMDEVQIGIECKSQIEKVKLAISESVENWKTEVENEKES